jgi:hypothetical protein
LYAWTFIPWRSSVIPAFPFAIMSTSPSYTVYELVVVCSCYDKMYNPLKNTVKSVFRSIWCTLYYSIFCHKFFVH